MKDLTYYQPEEERMKREMIPENLVWSNKEACEKQFKNSVIIEYSNGDIENTEFADVRTYELTDKEMIKKIEEFADEKYIEKEIFILKLKKNTMILNKFFKNINISKENKEIIIKMNI